MRKNILFSLITLCLFLIVLEALLQAFYILSGSKKKNTVNYYNWLSQNVRLNSFGYRDNEFSEEKPAGTYRIYAVGDSFTYGLLIDKLADTYPKKLERALRNKTKKDIEVINAGNPGFSIFDDVNRFLWDGKKLHPDLVVLGLNYDEINVSNVPFVVPDPPLPSIIKKLKLYQLTLGGYYRYLGEKTYREKILRMYTDPQSREWKEFSRQILLLQKSAESIHAKLAIVVFPQINPLQPNKPYDFYLYDERLKSFGKAHDILIVDPLEKVKAYPDKRKLVYSSFDSHPTPIMTQIMVNRFLEVFPIQQYLKVPQELLTTSTTALNANTPIPDYAIIHSVTDVLNNQLAYFENNNRRELHLLRLTGPSHILPDYLITGTEGPMIQVHLKSESPGKLIVPKNLYGYNVLGIDRIVPISDINNATDYANVKEITKKPDSFVITYQDQPYYKLFRVDASINSPEVSVDYQNSEPYVLQPITVTLTISTQIKTISIPLGNSLQTVSTYQPSPTEKQPYAFVDGKQTNVTKNQKGQTLILGFPNTLKKNQKVAFTYFSKFTNNGVLILHGEN